MQSSPSICVSICSIYILRWYQIEESEQITRYESNWPYQLLPYSLIMCHRVHNLHIWSVRYYPLHSHYIQYLYSTVEDLINIRSLFFELLLYSSVSVDILSYLCEYLSQFPFSLSETWLYHQLSWLLNLLEFKLLSFVCLLSLFDPILILAQSFATHKLLIWSMLQNKGSTMINGWKTKLFWKLHVYLLCISYLAITLHIDWASICWIWLEFAAFSSNWRLFTSSTLYIAKEMFLYLH